MTTSTKRPDGGELKPCPFCGGKAMMECIGEDTAARWSAGCSADEEGCMAYQSLTSFARRSDAVKAWNTRTPTNESPAPQAWRDINTAPRDGTDFLAWQDAERGPFKCWWHTEWPRAEAYWMDPQDSEPEPKFWRPMLPVPLER